MKRSDLKAGGLYLYSPSNTWAVDDHGQILGKIKIVDTDPAWFNAHDDINPMYAKENHQVVAVDAKKPWHRVKARAVVLVEFQAARYSYADGNIIFSPAVRFCVKLAAIRGPWEVCEREREAKRADRRAERQQEERARDAERKLFEKTLEKASDAGFAVSRESGSALHTYKSYHGGPVSIPLETFIQLVEAATGGNKPLAVGS